MQSCESSVVILLLPNSDVSAAPTQGGSAASTRLLRVVSQHQKLSFMIMDESPGDFVYPTIHMGCLKFSV